MHLFGSSLIKKYFPDFRKPNDIDWVTNDKSKLKESSKEEEFHYIPCSPDREMTPNELYTIKVSHAIYDIHWRKTMSDIRFLQIKGCELIPDMLVELRKYWEVIHGKQIRTDFDTDVDGFFNDKVRRKIKHDDLHHMLNDPPTFLKMIDDGVTPNINKFESLSENEKKELLFEESFVISIERFNNDYNKFAYNKAQQLLVTKLHPVWLSDFVINNWSKWYWNPIISKFYDRYSELKEELK